MITILNCFIVWVLFGAFFVMSAQKLVILADPISTFYKVDKVGIVDS
jgi:hypothetical protein